MNSYTFRDRINSPFRQLKWTLAMTRQYEVLMKWLQVQMLRLRSFDWRQGSWNTHWLKDGVAKFGSNYTIATLSIQLDVSEDDILAFFDSARALEEMAGKSFTASWTGSGLTLSWLEEGILETKTDISTDYFEKDGAYFANSRWVDRIVYLDGTERTVRDSGCRGLRKSRKKNSLPRRDGSKINQKRNWLLEDSRNHHVHSMMGSGSTIAWPLHDSTGGLYFYCDLL